MYSWPAKYLIRYMRRSNIWDQIPLPSVLFLTLLDHKKLIIRRKTINQKLRVNSFRKSKIKDLLSPKFLNLLKLIKSLKLLKNHQNINSRRDHPVALKVNHFAIVANPNIIFKRIVAVVKPAKILKSIPLLHVNLK